MDLATLQAQLNVAQLQLVALTAANAANSAQLVLQYNQNVAALNAKISGLNTQIAAVQQTPAS